MLIVPAPRLLRPCTRPLTTTVPCRPPQDYLFRYFRGIEDVSRSDVLAAAAAHLHPESQAVVVVADRELAAPSLEAAGFEVVPMRLEDA